MRGAMTGDTSEDYARRRVRELTEEIKRLHADVLYEQERNANNVHAYQDRIDAALTIAAYKARIDAARALHVEGAQPDCWHNRYCSACGKAWPCPTVKALEGEK